VASEAGLRIIGIDRPGYGLSTPQPGRTIAGWVPEALAVADHLGIGQFAAVGISTGGAYALALAALAPARVLGVVACCSMTDMRWPEGRATMSWPHVQAVWEARPCRGPGCGYRCARRGWQQDARRDSGRARSV
jgi:pimeloyl-ACP methyl ester carboxylesterase